MAFSLFCALLMRMASPLFYTLLIPGKVSYSPILDLSSRFDFIIITLYCIDYGLYVILEMHVPTD